MNACPVCSEPMRFDSILSVPYRRCSPCKKIFTEDYKEVSWEDTACRKCHRTRTDKGHDPCIPNLPGAAYACCGHGTKQSYIAFKDGTVIIGFKIDREAIHEASVIWRNREDHDWK